ncbi:MAG: diadenylate cyclase [Thermodesulfobacteriota bacterium]|nr:diadenylate cyclase [Thermodesulfobacteriota bacterium]
MNNFLSFFSSIRWQDIVDISLNSYILFRFYILFRGTNAFRVLIGIAFLWFFQRLAFSLGLIITSWAIQGITAVAALIIVVVFRNEIRSVLQAKNFKTILWGFSQKVITSPVEIIAESVFELAKKHTGALIVFPANEDIEEVVQSGISWRGVVSKEMIMSIFWHDNPVHDGAAIIHKDKITEVACILPLSHKNDLPSYYGTRHRAALGLAESTDAMVVVVSEERGTVSVARNSIIYPVNNRKELERQLQEHLGDRSMLRHDQRKETFRISAAALVSFMFIVGVWFSFSRGLETLVNVETSVEYMNRNSEVEIIDTSVNSVTLNLSGSGSLIKSMRPEQVKVKIDLGKASVGKNSFVITDENVSLPPGIFLKKVTPPIVDVTLGIPVVKEVPIQVEWTGKLPKHLLMEKVKINPSRVVLIGGSRILDRISTVYTEKVYLDNIYSSDAITVKLALSPSIKTAPGSSDTVTVEYIVKKR